MIQSNRHTRCSGTTTSDTTTVFDPLPRSPSVRSPPQSSSTVTSSCGMIAAISSGAPSARVSPSTTAFTVEWVEYGTPDWYGDRPLTRYPPSTRTAVLAPAMLCEDR
ncbi:hypothetical protein DMO24_10580 [Modestobacter versicolor]|uniref:Uncharacterized protein n=1 Tax=Modestobacter versicolor TaxID=429133 RepID=A0A323V981_9ACTN|nr:hypothetical protein DMO24_10580 [Modestobacter versicolor]